MSSSRKRRRFRSFRRCRVSLSLSRLYYSLELLIERDNAWRNAGLGTYAVLHSGVNGIFAGHQSAPGRRAYRSDIISVEQQAGVREGVDIRCRDLAGAVKTNVIPSLVITKINVDIASWNNQVGLGTPRSDSAFTELHTCRYSVLRIERNESKLFCKV